MEESLDILSEIRKAFEIGETDVRAYSPLTLAYIGDAIYDLIIRTVLVERANQSPHKLHKKAENYVKAGAQANYIMLIQDILTEEEKAVYKRGRNAKPYTCAKNASVSEYHKATGFEALIGWLYLNSEYDRMFELIREAMKRADTEI